MPIVSVVAAPGYGKSTAVAQWVARLDRPHAWVTLVADDDDPATLLSWVAAALAGEAATGAPGRLSPRRVARTLRQLDPVVLVLDDAHVLHDTATLGVLDVLIAGLGPASQLVLVGRSEVPSLGRLRLQHGVADVLADDLALTEAEGQAVLSYAGVTAGPQDVRTLLERTEGWPAAFYLAATAARRGGGFFDATAVNGDNRVLASYLHAEVMATFDTELVAFLRRSSVLRRMSGPLCDAVLQRSGSGDLLERLCTANLLVLPMDADRQWYRYHPLLRGLLLAELERDDPAALPQLRARAARWTHEHGDPLVALDYAWEAGEDDVAAALVLALGQPLWAAGKAVTAQRWFDRLASRGVVERRPELAAMWAYLLTLNGRAAEADRWADRALAATSDRVLPDGSTLAAWQALVRSLLCRDGPAAMLDDAQEALRRLGGTSPLQATALLQGGIAALLAGADQQAAEAFADAAELGAERNAVVARQVAIAELGLLAVEGRDWPAARQHRDLAVALTREGRLEAYPTSASVHALDARVARHDGDVEAYRAAVGVLAELRPQLTHSLPHLSVQVRLVVAEGMIAAGERIPAAVLLDEADAVLRRRPDVGVLAERATALRVQLADGLQNPALTMLTAAEVRLLPLLPTHLSFRAIGERLYLSPHTIKSQALSTYRKLGVSSRSEAVARARELGLLDH
ncbi:MAG: hypothetical protein EPO13_12180 [Actinomycetota bacterium]|nr:MAG: hypothetical protein EPO13_12180 [Actinomycetota bacterium]